MDMTGEYRLAAPRTKVWAALNDPEILKQCIPGCEEINKLSDTEMTAKVTAKVGPVSARFGGKVTLSDLDPPNGYKISGEGSGGAAGFAKGGATVKLADEGGGTLLTYAVDAHVGGKLAQIGSRLIDATARKMAGDFFSRFAAVVDQPVEAAPAAPAAASPSSEPAYAGAAPNAEAAAPSAGPRVSTAGPTAAVEPAAAAPTPIAAGEARVAAAEAPARGRLGPGIWVAILVIAIAILLYFFVGRSP